MAPKLKALFLDRDDTIIKNIPYMSKVSDISYLPGVFDKLKKIQDLGYTLFVVTNQSGLSRELISFSELELIHSKIQEDFLLKGIKIRAFYISPYIHNNFRRKPGPGLLLEAEKDFSIDLGKSIMIGDGLRDVDAGKAAKVWKTFQVTDCKRFWEDLKLSDFYE